MPPDLLVVGLSYRTATLDVRERVAFAAEAIEPALRELNEHPAIGEAVLLSTCNRVEVYAAASDASPAAEALQGFFHLDAKHLYTHVGPAAVKHVFRVAASLDSQVLGEPQILGQLKDAYSVATKAGCVGPLLGRCLERAFGVAKRVRTETAIARGAANVSSVSVDLAKSVFGELDGRSLLVVGAGKMSALAARHLMDDGASELVVTNRSPARAEELAREVGGTAAPFDDLPRLLAHADLVVTSTGAREPIITKALLKATMKARRHKPLFVVDIAVPRDVEPEAGKLDGVYLFDIDDLERVAGQNRREREKEAQAAERIVEAETAQFLAWLRSQGVVPTIKELRERFQGVAAAEAEKTVSALGGKLDAASAEQIRRMADAIVNKLLHTPSMALKQGSEDEALLAAARRLFALAEGDRK
jgi:glutamyl-tRNA reductase